MSALTPSLRARFGLRLALMAPLVLASACGVSNLFLPTQGKLEVSVLWPAKAGYGLMAIPEGTKTIEVNIFGEGIPSDAPLHVSLTDHATGADFNEVPIGAKVVKAAAFDADNHELAYGERAIAVMANQLNEARIELTPDGQPGSSPTPSTPASGGPDGTGSPGASPGVTPTPAPAGPVVTTVAGTGVAGTADSLDGLKATLHSPRAMIVDLGSRVLYFSDDNNRLIRSYDLLTRAVTTVARVATEPTASPGPENGTANGLAIASDGTLYFADALNNQIRRVQADHSIVTIAGSGKAGSDNGPGSQASFNGPVALAFGIDGFLYVSDQLNNQVRKIDLRDGNYTVSTLAGSGDTAFTGDAGPALAAGLNRPGALALAPGGSALYVAEVVGDRVRKIQLSTGIISTVAGNGATGRGGEGGPAYQASLSIPQGLTFDNLGHLYIADGWANPLGSSSTPVIGAFSRVLLVDDSGRLQRVAGQVRSASNFSGDGGPALNAEFNNPTSVAFDDHGNLFILDSFNNRLRELNLSVTPTTSSGPAPGPAPTDVPASGAATR